MVMGYDGDGQPAVNLFQSLAPLLDRSNLTSSDKIRLIMLYNLTQPAMKDADSRSMRDHAKLDSNDLESLRQLSNLVNVLLFSSFLFLLLRIPI